MQLHLEGSEDPTCRRRAGLSAAHRSSSFIAKSLLDAEETKVVDDSNIEAKVKIKMSFLTAHMAVKLKIADKVPSKHARLYVDGSGSGQQHEDRQRLATSRATRPRR